MHTPSIRTLAAIAYERGEEFDPALMLSPALAEDLDGSAAVLTAGLVFPSSEERGRRRGHEQELRGRRGLQKDGHIQGGCP